MKVFIIGTGNVALALGKAILKAGVPVDGVFGRNPAKAASLSGKLKTRFYSDLSKVPVTCDIYIIAVKDSAIKEVSNAMPAVKGIVAHTSGSVPIDALARHLKRGVFYPVETITGKQPASFRRVPVCLEANSRQVKSGLTSLASKLSGKLYYLDSGQRMILHVAAVFTNNFTNYLLGVATGILDEHKLPHELVETLAATTVKNAFRLGPLKAQTGPARRNDVKTIQQHLHLLKNNQAYIEIYNLITKQISDLYITKNLSSSKK